MACATLLLPARSRLPEAAVAAPVARAFDRAVAVHGSAGEQAQLARHFRLADAGWPVAALTRQRDAGDAQDGVWLRADPCHVAPDMHGARMLGHGPTLALEAADAQAFAPVLQGLFADAGLVFDAPAADRWYIKLPSDAQLPVFASPEDVLGDDLFGHLPHGESGRRWRALLSEAQVLLHAHPHNAQRVAQGQRAVNSLWFWGAGALPSSVSTPHQQVRSPDPLVLALAAAAGVAVTEPITGGQATGDVLVDLRQLRSLQQLADGAVQPLLAALARGELKRVQLDFEDGLQLQLDRHQRWKFWARPRPLHRA